MYALSATSRAKPRGIERLPFLTESPGSYGLTGFSSERYVTRARARARGPSELASTLARMESLDLEKLMEEAQVNYAQRDELRRDPPRAAALLDHALRKPNVEKPAAYALARFRKGEWPTGKRDGVGAYQRASRLIYGHGWDESYGVREMEEELTGVYDRAGERLPDETRRTLLSLWEAESLRRYPPDALTAAEWAALDPEQLELLGRE